ncbi:MAG: glycosyltransferase [Bacteroidaceae bacterium]
MTKSKLISPDYIFETSWEVCNKVGGIYTVLSTRANTLQKSYPDKLFFIGPDLWLGKKNPFFLEDATLLKDWKQYALEVDHLNIRVGRWNVPGKPITILVDFQSFLVQKDAIYGQAWELGKVDSLHAYGDYDECCMFAFAAAKVVASFYQYNQLSAKDRVVFQSHEWQTGMAMIFIKKWCPQIGTIFTTHATSIGRSIAGNHKPLYDYLFAYNGDQMARELNMVAKHSVEKQATHSVDCFTTVSEITNNECKELLERPADVILMNGFEDDFVPKASDFTRKRNQARGSLFRVANALTGFDFPKETLIVGTSGRYEFKNKGLDVFLRSLRRLNKDKTLDKDILAFVYVPAWVGDARADLLDRLKGHHAPYDTPVSKLPMLTHWLHNMSEDKVLDSLKYFNLWNFPTDKVKVIFVPCYLDGNDGIFNKTYYDLLIGSDLTIYPSYYEPWGYTPLESVAFKVPTITTNKAGFGLWAVNHLHISQLNDGVAVLNRTDYNSSEVADDVKECVMEMSKLNIQQRNQIRRRAAKVASKALWSNFIKYYYEAYDIALRNAEERNRITT